MDIDLNDVIAIMQQQLSQAHKDAAMNGALAMAKQRRIAELEELLREMKEKAAP